jgi:DNA-binding transcriptional LysR family regulator
LQADTASALLHRLLARGKFRHVQVLLRLAELGSVQRTADAIAMTQSSVTQTLAYLEKLLETPLFERHARGVRPTPACVDLLPVARQLMMGVAESADVIAARQHQGEGVVRVIGSAAATNRLLLAALPSFAMHAPRVAVHLREAEGEDQLLAITRGEVDLVACRHPPVLPEGWEFHPLRQDRYAIVCRADNPLAHAATVGLDALARETWLLLPAHLAARERFDTLAGRFPQRPATYPLVTGSPTMLWWLLRHCNLLTLLPLSLAQPLLDAGELAELAVGPPEALKPLGVLQSQQRLGPAAAKLSAFLRAFAFDEHPGSEAPAQTE